MSKLEEAKQILAVRGRTTTGGLEDNNGCLCPIGALCVAYTGVSGEPQVGSEYSDPYHPKDPHHLADLERLSLASHNRLVAERGLLFLPEHRPNDFMTIYLYNDGKAHTDEQVLSLFDDAKALV